MKLGRISFTDCDGEGRTTLLEQERRTAFRKKENQMKDRIYTNPITRGVLTSQELGEMISAVADEGRGLSKAEESVVAAIVDYWERGGALSDNQVAIIYRLYTEKVK